MEGVGLCCGGEGLERVEQLAVCLITLLRAGGLAAQRRAEIGVQRLELFLVLCVFKAQHLDPRGLQACGSGRVGRAVRDDEVGLSRDDRVDIRRRRRAHRGDDVQKVLVTFRGASDHLDVVADVGDDVGELVAEHHDILRLLVDRDVSDRHRPVVALLAVTAAEQRRTAEHHAQRQRDG